MKLIQILNQFFTIKGELGTKFCVSADSDRNNNVTRVEYITVQSTKKLPADWQNEKKRHSTTDIAKVQPIEQKLSGLGMAYAPAATAVQVLNTVVPDSMGDEVNNALANLKKAVGDVSGFVAERLQFSRTELADRLAAEQVDAVALSIFNIEAREQGFIIGDQTGVGKGRIAAAMIRYAIVQGHTPVFITEKPNLFTDFYRDLTDIGCPQYRPFIINTRASNTVIKDKNGEKLFDAPDEKTQRKIIESGELTKDYDFVLTTYSQFSDEDYTPKKNFLVQMADDNIIVMDEAHNAAGVVDDDESEGDSEGGFKRKQKGSNRATYFTKTIVPRVKGVVFLSATFAKRPDNMPLYAIKTCIGETSLKPNDLATAITKGGVALQEVLSANVVKEGQMMRREKSKDQIITNYIYLNKEGKARFGVKDSEKHDRQTLDSITELMRDIIEFQKTYIEPIIKQRNEIFKAQNIDISERKGTKKMGVDNPDFVSKTYNLMAQLLFAIKAEQVAERAVYQLRNGKKVVIGFSYTMQALLDSLGASGNGEEVSPYFAITLLKGLASTLLLTEKDDKGNTTKSEISLDELGENGANMYKFIQHKIRKNSAGVYISPIDVMLKIIKEAGFTVEEVTGRSLQVNYNKDFTKATINKRAKVNVADAFRNFQNNETDCIFINAMGATGASAHAIPTPKVKKEDVKQRVMIMIQAELDISKEVQKRGRIDRTGQIYPPIYEYVVSAIPSEKRSMMALQKKLKSLDANTTSNQKQSKTIIEYDDFLNKYGDIVVAEYLLENPDVAKTLDVTVETNKDTGEPVSREGFANKISNYVALLPTAQQEDFYDSVLEMYKEFVNFKIQAGEYDLEMEIIDLEAETITKTPTIAAKGIGKSVFSMPTYEEVVSVNVLKKPFTKKELDQRITDAQKRKSNDTIVNEFGNAVKTKALKDIERVKARWAEVQSNIKNEKGYQRLDKSEQNDYITTRVSEIAEAQQTEIQTIQEKANSQFFSIRQLIEAFQIGTAWSFSFGETIDMQLPCVCLGVVINEKARNPYAPSAMHCEFAVSDSTRFFQLNFAGQQRMSLQSIKEANRWSFQNELVANWDEYTKKRSANREKRLIITGNILQAFDREDYRSGKLISFTRKNGDIDKGILIRKDKAELILNSSKTVVSKLTIPIDKAREAIIDLPRNGNFMLSGKVQISRTSSYYTGEVYELHTFGGSMDEFAWLVKNEKLKDLATNENGFMRDKSGKFWNAYFKIADIGQVIDILAEIGVNATVEGVAAEKMQKQLSDEFAKAGGNWKKLSWNESNIPVGAKNISPKKTTTGDTERIRIAEAEMLIEIEIMEMELEMGKYRSVAGTDTEYEYESVKDDPTYFLTYGKPTWVLFSIWRENVEIENIETFLKSQLVAERKKLKNAKLHKDKDAIFDYQDNINDLKSLSKYDFFVGKDSKIHFTQF